MPLFTGTWKINVNGTEGSFVINSIGIDGTVSGTVLLIRFTGFWNESSQTIFFESITPISGVGPFGAEIQGGDSRAQFIGYLFPTPPNTSAGSDILWTLCGHVTAPVTGGISAVQPNSHRVIFGWFAQVTQVI